MTLFILMWYSVEQLVIFVRIPHVKQSGRSGRIPNSDRIFVVSLVKSLELFNVYKMIFKVEDNWQIIFILNLQIKNISSKEEPSPPGINARDNGQPSDHLKPRSFTLAALCFIKIYFTKRNFMDKKYCTFHPHYAFYPHNKVSRN